MKSKLNEFYADPFEAVDSLNLGFKIRGQDFSFNFFQKWRKLRATALGVVVVCSVLWIFLGFDSTPLQFIHALYEVPRWLFGSGSFQDVINQYVIHYGKEMHYSAFVIYGAMFYFFSSHFEKTMSWTGSRNICYSSAIVFLAVSVFEFFWMFSFATFQNQAWIITPAWPQLRIHLQNLAFLLVGSLTILYMWIDSFEINEKKDIIRRFYTFRVNWIALALVLLAIGSAIFWIYYPGHVEPLSVTLDSGEIWTNTRLFPQTLYTIDLNPTDGVNAGEWFWIEDNFIHGINTYVKAVWSLVFVYVFKVNKK